MVTFLGVEVLPIAAISVLSYVLFCFFFIIEYKQCYHLICIVILELVKGATGSSWGISSIFGASEDRPPAKQNSMNKSYNAPVQTLEHSFSMIQLREVRNIMLMMYVCFFITKLVICSC